MSYRCCILLTWSEANGNIPLEYVTKIFYISSNVLKKIKIFTEKSKKSYYKLDKPLSILYYR